MTTTLNTIVFLIFCVFSSCSNNKTVEIRNEKKGHLKATLELKEVQVKKFILDSVTAPRALYTQIFSDTNGIQIFTLLNTNNNSIYFYNYKTSEFIQKITIDKQGLGEQISPTAYYIKTMDSIYVYNMPYLDVYLINRRGSPIKRVSLIGNKNIRDARWVFRYPQYYPRASVPFMKTDTELLLVGQYMRTIPDSIINKFNFLSHIDFNLNKVTFSHTYPRSLYGSDYNWEGQMFTEVYADYNQNEDKLLFSFPISHDVYISDVKSNVYNKIYAGSNVAGTIYSIDAPAKSVSRNMIIDEFANNDEYGAIKYDSYRKVYYRFLKGAVSAKTEYTKWKEKPVSVILMDEKFNYLGETTIGTINDWYLPNTFVTEEGLNIEYIDKNSDETYLILKIFSIKKIK